MDEQHLIESHMAISIEALWTMPVTELLAAYYEAWDPHTITDPDVAPLLRALREHFTHPRVIHEATDPADGF